MSLQVRLLANYQLSRHWSINGRIALTRLADEISDSPIVDDELVSSSFLGFGYRF